MKLHKLEIKNIASIEEATIDFEAKPLSDSNVFLITGETGAGKSTILDAICLALYATTPRMWETEMDGSDINDMGVTDTQQLMRKNTDEAYARLAFLGSDGNEYEAEWHVERKTKNLTRTWTLKNLTHPDHSPAPASGIINSDGSGRKDNNAIVEMIRESAVGLSFDQFCRTTMLAQGEFTRFLKSGKKEKAAILEKITDTEEYAKIGAKIHELTEKYKKEMDKVDPEQQEQPLKPEDRQTLDDEIRGLKKQIGDINKQLEILEPQYNWLTQEKTLNESLTRADENVKKARSATQTPEYKQLKKDIDDYNLSGNARLWLAAINQAKGEIQQAINDIEALNLPSGTNLTEEEIKVQQSLTNGLIANIRVAKTQVSAYFQAKDQREKLKSSFADRKNKLTTKEGELKRLDPLVINAQKEFEDCDAEYEKLNLAVGTLQAKMRESIQEGGKCPICGQVVASKNILPHEDELRQIVDEAKNKRDNAEQAYKGKDGIKTQYDTLSAEIKVEKENLERDQRNFDNDHSLEKSKDETTEALKECGIAWSDDQATLNRALEEKSTEAAEQKKHEANLLKWIGYNAKKEAAEERLGINQQNLDAFQVEHKDLTDERLEELKKMNISEKTREKERIDNNLFSANGAWSNINSQIDVHTKQKPEKWIEGKGVDELQEEITRLKEQISPLSKANGEKEEQQRADNLRRNKINSLQEQYEQKKQVFEKWNRLCKLIGDKYGDKFRIIAQSYILGNLINAANKHMQTLTDRYVLHVVPGRDLIILVEDRYQGGVKRPASNISGGEGFLVSLALALALSEIGQSLKVEMLFIDEGFGTLSGEPLMKAINTLEALHDTNNRQVCAISHREEVKERIPVQIQVNQASQSSASTIEIVPKMDAV